MIKHLVQTHFAIMVMVLFIGIACLVLLAMRGAQ